ncbi:hypothetical protein [Microbispora sp. CSR-4]|uniref:hypothetical protein n=1 Tax=Microbispora sp. CSR-4 TaxID=2592813 RepID=UPI0011C96AAB|nr:hypothetical protein [Microbispora sp. CSR-4]
MTQDPTQTHCPDGVPWCISTRHAGPGAAHLADIETIDLGDHTAGVIVFRPVDEPDPAAAVVRIHYAVDGQEPAVVDLPPAGAAVLGELMSGQASMTVFLLARALKRGAELVEGPGR